MPFTVAVVYYSQQGRLVTLANVIAEGAKSVRALAETAGFFSTGRVAAGPFARAPAFEHAAGALAFDLACFDRRVRSTRRILTTTTPPLFPPDPRRPRHRAPRRRPRPSRLCV